MGHLVNLDLTASPASGTSIRETSDTTPMVNPFTRQTSGSSSRADSVSPNTTTNTRRKPVRATPHKRRLSARAIEEIRLRKNDRVITECGCITIPEIVSERLGVKSCFCDTHGEQKIIRIATGREVIAMTLGIDLPVVSEDDVCPF